jgi:hypothetical protein
MKIKRPLRRTPDPSSAGDAAAKEMARGSVRVLAVTANVRFRYPFNVG